MRWKNYPQDMWLKFYNNINHYKKVIQNVKGGNWDDISVSVKDNNGQEIAYYSKDDLLVEEEMPEDEPYFSKNIELGDETETVHTLKDGSDVTLTYKHNEGSTGKIVKMGDEIIANKAFAIDEDYTSENIEIVHNDINLSDSYTLKNINETKNITVKYVNKLSLSVENSEENITIQANDELEENDTIEEQGTIYAINGEEKEITIDMPINKCIKSIEEGGVEITRENGTNRFVKTENEDEVEIVRYVQSESGDNTNAIFTTDIISQDKNIVFTFSDDMNHNNIPDDEEPTYTLTINYIYSAGEVAAETYTNEYLPGIEYSVNTPEIEYYTADKEVVTGTMGEEDEVVTVTYTPNHDENEDGIADELQHDLTINYVYSRGEEAKESYTNKYIPGAEYSVTSPEIEYYTADKEVVTGTMGEEDEVVTVTYTPNHDENEDGIADEEETKNTLIIKYVYEIKDRNGNITEEEARPMHTEELLSGIRYSIVSPEIEYYIANPDIVTGTMEEQDKEETVRYIPVHDENENGIADENEYINITINLDEEKATVNQKEQEIKFGEDSNPIKIYPKEGYAIKEVKVNGEVVERKNEYVFRNVKEDIRMEIIFGEDTDENGIPDDEDEKLWVKVNKYEVEEEENTIYISNVNPETLIKEFVSNIETNGTIEIMKKETKITEYDSTYIGTGFIVKISYKKESIEYKVVVTGDLNGDGRMSDGDLVKLARYIAKLDLNLNGEYYKASDVHRDKKYAGDSDLVKMARILVRLDKFE